MNVQPKTLRRLAFTAGVAVWSVALGLAGSASAGSTPRGVIEQTSKQVLAVLQDRGVSPTEKVSRIEVIADQHFDFETVSRLVVARHWNELGEDQKRDFVQQFKKHLSVTYGRNVDRYEDGQIELLGDREEARGDWTVKSRIFRRGDEFLVDYRLRKQADEWRIIDVLVEGSSLISNFRAQFQEIIASRGVARLLELLREKNASGESIIGGSQSTKPHS